MTPACRASFDITEAFARGALPREVPTSEIGRNRRVFARSIDGDAMRCAIWGAMLAVVMSHSAVGQSAPPDAARGIAAPADKGYAVEQIGEELY